MSNVGPKGTPANLLAQSRNFTKVFEQLKVRFVVNRLGFWFLHIFYL